MILSLNERRAVAALIEALAARDPGFSDLSALAGPVNSPILRRLLPVLGVHPTRGGPITPPAESRKQTLRLFPICK